MTVLSEGGATRTTGLVAQTDTYTIAMTGRKHVGENVADLLLRRPDTTSCGWAMRSRKTGSVKKV